jgi:hypothetical protein
MFEIHLTANTPDEHNAIATAVFDAVVADLKAKLPKGSAFRVDGVSNDGSLPLGQGIQMGPTTADGDTPARIVDHSAVPAL